jgi:hypothetical protein
LIPLDVTKIFRVSAAIYFNYQTMLMTHEIDNEPTNWCLATKADAVETMRAQRRP